MQQQAVFPVLSVQTSYQAKLAKDLAVITNILGLRVIEIEQRNPNIRQLEGIMVCKYKEVAQTDEDLMAPGGVGHTESNRFPHEIVGGSLTFIQNPYARRAVGTGRVAFLIDDEEPTPRGAMSGATKGWNREFLASHMADPVATGYWQIVDDDIRREIAARADSIKSNAAKAAKGEAVPGVTDWAIAVGPQVPLTLDGTAPVDYDPRILPADQVLDPVEKPMELTEEQKLAQLSEKFGKAISRIEAIEAENASLRVENERLRRTPMAAASNGPRKKGPKPAMAGGFAGKKA